jgi:hypothetical protein
MLALVSTLLALHLLASSSLTARALPFHAVAKLRQVEPALLGGLDDG